MEDIQMNELAKLLLARKTGERIFVNTKDNHYKVWMVYRDGDNMITTYGRIGQTMRTTEKELSRWAGAIIMDNKINEKRRKGYKEVR